MTHEMYDYLLLITMLEMGAITVILFRKVLRRDGLVGFLRHVTERDAAGDDLLLFALGLCFILVTLTTAAAGFHLPFTREKWFAVFLRSLTTIFYFVLLLHFANGRLAVRLAHLIRHRRLDAQWRLWRNRFFLFRQHVKTRLRGGGTSSRYG